MTNDNCELCTKNIESAPADLSCYLLEGTDLCAEDLMFYILDWNLADQQFYNDDLFTTASWSLVMNSSTGIVPISPLCLDLIVRVLAWTSLGPTTAISGTFCVSAFLISFGRRSPWQTSTRNPLDFSSEATSLQYCNWKYKSRCHGFINNTKANIYLNYKHLFNSIGREPDNPEYQWTYAFNFNKIWWTIMQSKWIKPHCLSQVEYVLELGQAKVENHQHSVQSGHQRSAPKTQG